MPSDSLFCGMGVMGNRHASNGGWRGRRADTVDLHEPHWDWDDPEQTFVEVPDNVRRWIFLENAIETFNLRLPNQQVDAND